MSPAAEDRACAVLRAEHQVILRVLDVLEALIDRPGGNGGLEAAPLGQCVQFFQLFADACHHAKEEDLLFPVLEACGIQRDGGPIGVMLYEHRLARSLVARMGEALSGFGSVDGSSQNAFREAARDYLELLRQHIFKEDHVLFEAADLAMTEEDQARLRESFCEGSCQAFGGKRREELEAMADELERHWGTA
ncbi:MAG: hemerythrin domain-containing protein [Thermoanaerobaculia bacterium]